MDPLTLSLIGSAVGGVGQAIGAALPTAQSRYNRKQLDELLARQKAGQLGLTGAERQALERDALNPVRAMATEARRAQEATAAQVAGSSGVDAADLNRIRRGEQQALASAATSAGQAIGQANLSEAQRERNEIEQRLAFQAQRNTDVVNGVTGLLGTGAQLAGAAAGGPPLNIMGLFGTEVRDFGRFEQQLGQYGLDPADIQRVSALAQRHGANFPRVVQDSLRGGEMADQYLSTLFLDPGAY